MLGYEPEELREKQIEGDQRRRSGLRPGGGHGRMQRVIEGEPQTFDWLFEHRDGTTVWAEVSLKRTTIGGEPRTIAFVSDITERKERKRDLEFVERWSIPSAWASLPTGRAAGSSTSTSGSRTSSIRTASDCWSCRSVTSIRNWSPNDSRSTGRPSRKGKPGRRRRRSHSTTGEATVETVTTCMVVDGVRYHFGTVRTYSSVNDRKRAVPGVRRAVERHYQRPRRRGNYKYQSPSAERILGYEREALIGENAFEYIHPDDQEEVMGRFEAAIENPGEALVVEFRFRNADGSWRWLESKGFKLREPTRRGIRRQQP